MPNTKRKFDRKVAKILGDYVYVLRDPRDNKVFYVGKGEGNRLFAHFNEADKVLKSKKQNTWTAKLRRIVEIWEEDLDVDWWIVRYNLKSGTTPPLDAFDVEASLIDVLEISQNGPALNDIAGRRKTTRGILSADDVAALAAPTVNPKKPYPAVFIFPIQNALEQRANVYDATRRWWAVSQAYRSLPTPVAVGIANGITQGIFEIKQWAPASGKWEFTGTDVTNGHALANTSWLTIIGAAMGYWQRGNYLIIELNGKGKYRFLRGSTNKEWQRL